jgi:hypothetical protein
MGMSATNTNYTYAIYIWQSFFHEEWIGPTYCMIRMCMCIIELNLKKKQIEETWRQLKPEEP